MTCVCVCQLCLVSGSGAWMAGEKSRDCSDWECVVGPALDNLSLRVLRAECLLREPEEFDCPCLCL